MTGVVQGVCERPLVKIAILVAEAPSRCVMRAEQTRD